MRTMIESEMGKEKEGILWMIKLHQTKNNIKYTAKTSKCLMIMQWVPPKRITDRGIRMNLLKRNLSSFPFSTNWAFFAELNNLEIKTFA